MDNPSAYPIIGGISLLLCIILAYCYRAGKQQLDEMWAVDTYDARELRRMVSGGFGATVEVQGTVACDEPLTSLASQTTCCWFRTTVEREERKTRTVTETDSDGRRHTRTETYYEWDTEFDETYAAVFSVTDETGYTLVDPTNADIDAETVCNNVVYGREPWFDGSIGISDTGKYRIKEAAFAPQGFAYVLGQAVEHDGGAMVRYPDKGYLNPKKRFFIISRKTEKELTRSKQTRVTLCFWFAIAGLLGAGFCAACYFGLVR